MYLHTPFNLKIYRYISIWQHQHARTEAPSKLKSRFHSFPLLYRTTTLVGNSLLFFSFFFLVSDVQNFDVATTAATAKEFMNVGLGFDETQYGQ